MQTGALSRQLSFKHTLQLWVAWSQRQCLASGEEEMEALFVLIAQKRVRNRPNRVEPRAVKRRRKPFERLKTFRHVAREQIAKRGPCPTNERNAAASSPSAPDQSTTVADSPHQSGRPAPACCRQVKYRCPRCQAISSTPIASIPFRSWCSRPQACLQQAGHRHLHRTEYLIPSGAKRAGYLAPA